MSLQESEYRYNLRNFMEACKITGGHLTITQDVIHLTTEDERITGLCEVAKFMATKLEEHWEKMS